MGDTFNTLIKNGLVVDGGKVSRVDLGIRLGKVAKLTPNIPNTQATQVIDAEGKYVLPGIIDPHCHPVYVDNLRDSSITAAYGGVTTIIHYAYAKPGMQIIPTIKQFRDDGESNSLLDFALHVGLFDVKNQIGEIPAAFDQGVTSFKLFMTYAKLQWMTDDYWMTAVMDVLAKMKGLAMVHAENGLATDYLEDKFLREGASPVATFTAMRPDILEAEAVNRAMAIAQVMGCALYIVHNSAAACIEPLQRGRAKGWRVIGETCPHFLTLTDRTTARLKAQAKIGPPMRTVEDNEALWQGLANNTLQTVGSDHAPKPKNIDDDFFNAPYGAPQLETMLPVIYDMGVNGGHLTLPRLVQVMSENPARVFGLYPQKGALKVGSDADLVLYDPDYRWTISAKNQHSKVGYTLFEGMEVLGKPVMTMQRGQVIINGDQMMGKAGEGLFLPTQTAHLYKTML